MISQGANGAGPQLPVSRHACDLRGFIRRLDEAGCLVRITKAVDWKFEIGKITRERLTPLLFENVVDYPEQRVFTNGLCHASAISFALGLDLGNDRRALLEEVKNRIRKPIKPIVLQTGPVLENVVETRNVNLLALPVPWWNARDGGRYLGTWHINVTEDPNTGLRNVGVYRMQLLGGRRASVSASPGSHLSQHFAKAVRQNRPLPMAMAIGVSEILMMAAAAAYPAGMDEYELAGGLQQEPIKLVQCRTVNLCVPAHAEIVIEGFLRTDTRVEDGPYFDYSGKMDTNPCAFLFDATGVMFRNNPIFRGSSVGVPGAEDHQLFAFLAEFGLVDFHGSRFKKKLQNALLRNHLFRAFQFAGKLGALNKNANY